jgi:hypothetical protein
VSNTQTARAHKKSRPEPSDKKCPKKGAFSAQGNVAGDRQNEDAPLIEYEWKPSFVIKCLHRTTELTITSNHSCVTMLL